jgi:uncharacterized membrane-anchored protein YhcB (DUF1043 family)
MKTSLIKFFRRKNEAPMVTIDIIIGASIYRQLKTRAKKESVSENELLQYSIQRGMDTYWLQILKNEKEDYNITKKLFRQYKHDNKLLEAIITQNERLDKILNAIHRPDRSHGNL